MLSCLQLQGLSGRKGRREGGRGQEKRSEGAPVPRFTAAGTEGGP